MNARSPRSPVTRAPSPTVVRDDADHLEIITGVLVIGGGPAATWAALNAARTSAGEGLGVTLVDKGYCGASGVAATSGVGHWLTPPGSPLRDETFRIKNATGGGQSDRVWVDAVLDETWAQISTLPAMGWDRVDRNRRQPSLDLTTDNPSGAPYFRGPAPDYLRFLRGQVKKAGVTVLDHSPAVELLVTDNRDAVVGARGLQVRAGRNWTVHAHAVVLATGGTTWRSHSLGGDTNTGDGQLMAAEAGADLAAMEYSNFQGMVPFGTSMDKNGYFIKAEYWTGDGTPIHYDDLHYSRVPLLEHSVKGTVYARFSQFAPAQRATARENMPNFFAVVDKLGINPFTEHFPIDWVHEGTVRGTGGVRVDDTTCAVGLPGLYAAGDVAARDRITGAATGAGGPNLSWAVASGSWAGTHAARFAASRSGSPLTGRPGTASSASSPRGIRRHAAGLGSIATTSVGHDDGRTPDWRELTGRIRAQMLPLTNAVFRSEDRLASMLGELDRVWDLLRDASPRSPVDEYRLREVAGMAAMGRWATLSALERRESRAMHFRVDHPQTDPEATYRLLVSGVHRPRVHRQPSGKTRVGVPA